MTIVEDSFQLIKSTIKPHHRLTYDSADEIMAGLQEYAELAEKEIKKAVKKTATSVKKEISAKGKEAKRCEGY